MLSVGLLCYNHERFVRQAIQSVVNQTHAPTELVILDNASTDDSWAVIQDELNRHQISFPVRAILSEQNTGSGGGFSRLMSEMTSPILMAMAADDEMMLCRVEQTLKVFDADVMGLCSDAEVIDASGNQISATYLGPDWNVEINPVTAANGARVLGASASWRRSLFEYYGPLKPGIVLEDGALSFRASLLGKVIYIQLPLVRYRIHGNNLFQSYLEDFHTAKDYLASIARNVPAEVTLYEGMLADLDTFESREGLRPDSRALRNALANMIRSKRAESKMFTRKSRIRSLFTIVHSLGFISPSRAVRWTCWFVVPEVYFTLLKSSTARRIVRIIIPRFAPK